MNKQQFLTELERYLSKLSPDEKKDILQDFDEHFVFAIEEGKSEYEVVQSLGTPKQLAKELLADYHIEKMESIKSTGNVFRAVFSVIGLGFMNLILVLGPFIGLVGCMFAGWVVGISFLVSPLLVVLALVFNTGMTFSDFFVSIGLCGIGILISIGMYYATIVFKNVLLRYLKYNVSVVKGGIRHG